MKLTRAEARRLHLPVPPAPAKYRNVRTEVDGLQFDSRKEARRWGELRQLERAGRISDLRRQVAYELLVNGKKVGRYVADHVYVESGVVVVEDVKSAATRRLAAYRLKRRLMAACYGVEIREV